MSLIRLHLDPYRTRRMDRNDPKTGYSQWLAQRAKASNADVSLVHRLRLIEVWILCIKKPIEMIVSISALAAEFKIANVLKSRSRVKVRWNSLALQTLLVHQ